MNIIQAVIWIVDKTYPSYYIQSVYVDIKIVDRSNIQIFVLNSKISNAPIPNVSKSICVILKILLLKENSLWKQFAS